MELIENNVYVLNYKPSIDGNLYLVFEVVGFDNGINIKDLLLESYFLNPIVLGFNHINKASDYYICKIIYTTYLPRHGKDDVFFLEEDDILDTNVYSFKDYHQFINEAQIRKFLE